VRDERQTNRDATTHRPTQEERGLPTGGATKPAGKPAAKPAGKARVSVDVLYLYQSSKAELQRDVAFGRIRHPKAKRVRITSWKHLSQVLAGYDKIGTLVLMTHGREGGLKIDTWMDGAKAGAYLAKTGTQATTILFEGCMIMRSPVEGAQVAQGLKASTATGYNWWHFTGMQRFDLSKAPADEKVQKIVDSWVTSYGQFLIQRADGTAAQPATKTAIIDGLETRAKAHADAAKKAKKKTQEPAVIHLFTEWFHPDKSGVRADPSADPTRGELILKHFDNKADARRFSKQDHTKPPACQVTVEVAKVA
jgi:hypothetical protein